MNPLPHSEEFVLGEEYSSADVLQMIEEDDKPIRELIRKMRDPELSTCERIHAFQDFVPLFKVAASAKESALYEFMKARPDLRAFALTGETEDIVIQQLCEEIRASHDEHTMLGKIGVLAEVACNHLREEESKLFPLLRDEVSSSKLKRLARTYIMVETEIIDTVAH